MDNQKLYSWFLGPKAENADVLEKLMLEALRDCVFWRRNFHPEDDILITEKIQREDGFQDSLALLRQEFLTLLANLKRDVPFYSPRYIGHMLGDQLLLVISDGAFVCLTLLALLSLWVECLKKRRDGGDWTRTSDLGVMNPGQRLVCASLSLSSLA